jgi:hypothetical protein
MVIVSSPAKYVQYGCNGPLIRQRVRALEWRQSSIGVA